MGDLPVLPESVVAGFAQTPSPGEWYPIHELLTCAGAAPAVCLLSAVEIRATQSTLCVASRSSRAASNLSVSRTATLVTWSQGLHYIELSLTGRVDLDGVHGYRFDVTGIRSDDIGIEVQPLRYRMEEWLVAAERWETTIMVLDHLEQLAEP